MKRIARPPSPSSPSSPSSPLAPGAAAPFGVPPRPSLALPPRPDARRGLWAWPLLLSLAFVAAVLGWLQRNERAELEQQRAELITDALSLQADVDARIDAEAALLARFAARLDAAGDARDPAAPAGAARIGRFAAAPEVQQGLHRFWIALTWLDAANRIVVHLPEPVGVEGAAASASASATSAPARAPAWADPTRPGLSAHLRAPLASGGALVARYSPGEMLRQNVPWWLARKYDVRLVDSFDDLIASTGARDDGRADRQSYRIALAAPLDDAWLELIARDRVPPWWRGLPVALALGFVAVIAVITGLLRRQVRDVSRAEEAWRTEAAWRSAMEDSLTVGLRARDLDGRVLFVNRAFADLVGFPEAALVGVLPPMPYWPPDAIEASMERHRRNLQGEAPPDGYEVRWRHADGRPLDVMLFETRLVDARGRQIGWMGSVVDLTERKRLAERERRQTEAMTHHARLTMLGEIASTLAHELNQPLAAIASDAAGVANSLRRADADTGAARSPTDPRVHDALRRLGEQAAHAGRIVRRIRQFLTRREPQHEACALNAIVAGGVALLAPELARQRVALAPALDPTLPPILADAVLVEQVVVNLVRNAVDALADAPEADGPRRIVVASRRAADDADAVRLEVSDNGPGLGGRPIEALCAAFYTTKRDGMGMGLAICRSIVEAHHGTLDASEAPGGGARFVLTLPCTPPAGVPRAPPDGATPASAVVAAARPARAEGSGR